MAQMQRAYTAAAADPASLVGWSMRCTDSKGVAYTGLCVGVQKTGVFGSNTRHRIQLSQPPLAPAGKTAKGAALAAGAEVVLALERKVAASKDSRARAEKQQAKGGKCEFELLHHRSITAATGGAPAPASQPNKPPAPEAAASAAGRSSPACSPTPSPAQAGGAQKAQRSAPSPIR
jgi:hypothetical protein